MAKVSVIVPNYNHARYLARRIDSVLGQTFDDLDVLILDDCSTDDSRAVADAYRSDPRVRFHFNEQNSGGTYMQWRRALTMVDSDYVWIAESDDFAAPTFLTRLVEQLDADARVGLAVCNSYLVDADDNILSTYSNVWKYGVDEQGRDPLTSVDMVMNGKAYARAYMNPWNTIPNASAVLFRRAAFEAIGGPVTDMVICGDWMTYAKILMHYDIARVPDVLNHFRQHTANVRTRTKTIDFVCESMQVQRFVEMHAGGAPDRETHNRGRDFLCQVLIGSARAGPQGKVPIALTLPVVRDAFSLERALFMRTIRILATEQAGRIARRIGLRARTSS